MKVLLKIKSGCIRIMIMRIQILVRLREGVLDVQGKAVERNLPEHGIGHVRLGKLIELDVEADSFAAAKEKLIPLCQTVLTNPILETFEIREAH